jgi:hypothetical protein
VRDLIGEDKLRFIRDACVWDTAVYGTQTMYNDTKNVCGTQLYLRPNHG